MWANDLSDEAKRGAGPTQMAMAKTHTGGFGTQAPGSSSSSTNFHGKDKDGNMNLTTSGLNVGAPGLNKTHQGSGSYQLVSQRSFWDNVPQMPKTNEGSKSFRKLMINTMMTGSQNVFAQTSPEKFNRSKLLYLQCCLNITLNNIQSCMILRFISLRTHSQQLVF